jgi:hypothetical protein
MIGICTLIENLLKASDSNALLYELNQPQDEMPGAGLKTIDPPSYAL